jgi:hypothetical protein
LSFALRSGIETLAPGDVLKINPGDSHSGNYGSRGVDARDLTLHIPVRSLKEILTKMRFLGDRDHNRVLLLDKIGEASILPGSRS